MINQWTKKESDIDFEKISDTVLVESAGYIPQRTKIKQLLEAGHQLNNFIKDSFDFYDEYDPETGESKIIDGDGIIRGIEDVQVDLTRWGNFDLVDADETIRRLSVMYDEAERRAHDEWHKNNGTEAPKAKKQPAPEEKIPDEEKTGS